MSGNGFVGAMPRVAPRGWQWMTAVASCLTVFAAMAPASHQATTAALQSTGRLERMIVRAVPGHVGDAKQLVKSAGGSVGRELSIISGFVAEVPADAANGLRAATGVVTAVDADAPMQAMSVEPTASLADTLADTSAVADSGTSSLADLAGDFGSMASVNKLVGAPALWAAGATGSGVDVAVIDTGVAPVAGLSGKIVNGPDLSLDYQQGLEESVDAYGHGTHMAGIIAGSDAGSVTDPNNFVGVAPDARIVNVKVGAADGATDVSQVIAGIDWVVQHRRDDGMNIKVLNLSFGTLSSQSYTVDPLSYAAEVAWRNGVMVIAAAGNDGASVKQLADPAYNPRILAVGAYDPNNSFRSDKWTPADFTNGGSAKRSADVYAPGTHIMSLRVPGGYVDENYPESVVGTRFTRGSGTSQATAVMSGIAADLFDKYPNATPDQIKNVILETSNEFKTSLLGSLTNLLTLDSDAGTVNGAKALTKSLSSNSNGRQEFTYAKGTGSLEAARGGVHLNNGVSELTGEQDIFGNAWTPQTWAAAAADGTSWNGGMWNGQRWSGDDWAGQRWSNALWSGNDWAGQRWSGQRWSGAIWDGQRWSGQRWSGQRWSGGDWAGQRWSASIWG